MFESSQMMPLFAVPVWAQVLEPDVADALKTELLGQLDNLGRDVPDKEAGW